MTLENIYYVGQTVAVVAILMSLLAVVWQMRQSQKMERAAAQRDLLQRVTEWTLRANDPSGPPDWLVRGMMNYDDADVQTQAYVENALSGFVFITESALNMRRDGFFSDGTWSGIEGAALSLIRTPGGRQWWTHAQKIIGYEIVEHLNHRLNEVPDDLPTTLDLVPSVRRRRAELEAQAAA